MQSKFKNGLKASVFLSLLCVGFSVSILYLSSVQEPIVQSVCIKRDPYLVTAGPGDPGFDPDDPTQLINIQIRPHVANGWTTYNSNCSNATAYEYGLGNGSGTGETPFATTFDIVVTVEISYNDGYNQTSSAWDDSYSWVTCTCADLSIGANTNMSEIQIAATGDHRYLHYWLNNTGSGYTIALGESFNITSIKYWVMRPTS